MMEDPSEISPDRIETVVETLGGSDEDVMMDAIRLLRNSCAMNLDAKRRISEKNT